MRIPSRIGPSRAVGVLMGAVVVSFDTVLQRCTAARLSVGRALGLRWLLLITGTRSGLPREVPLFHVPHECGFAVVVSNFGQAHHPAWTANLLRHPYATVTLDGRSLRVTVRRVHGTAREQVWRALLALIPGSQLYNDRAGREPRIFHLQPTPAGQP